MSNSGRLRADDDGDEVNRFMLASYILYELNIIM